MTRTTTSINDLPPELLRAIVHRAAEHSMTKESFVTRLRTLSALSLVNRTFREIAQPLLATIVHVGLTLDRRIFVDKTLGAQVNTLVYNEFHVSVGDRVTARNLRSRFEFLQDLRFFESELADCNGLNGHEHLKRLAFDYSVIEVPADWSGFVLPHLEELSVAFCDLQYSDRPIQLQHSEGKRLPTSRFPSLRALATRMFEVRYDTAHGMHPLLGDFDFQLECLITDGLISQIPKWIPFIYDIDSSFATESMFNLSDLRDEVPEYRFLRIRLPCIPNPSKRRISAALRIAELLIENYDMLEELYLDLYPRDARRGYKLDEALERRVGAIEELAEANEVEIIWENHEDDIMKSLVSREFWKRRREEKRRRKGGI